MADGWMGFVVLNADASILIVFYLFSNMYLFSKFLSTHDFSWMLTFAGLAAGISSLLPA